MKETVSTIIGACVLVFFVFFLIGEIPDSFRRDGIYFDKFPKWMGLVFVIGVAAISILSAFIADAITYSILECKEIKIWIKVRLQRYKNRGIYKFHDVTKTKSTIKPTIKF